MVAKRECCITEDPYAYDLTEITTYAIGTGYNTTNDWITYSGVGHTHSPAFKTLRVEVQSDNVSREVMVEEATDQAAAASVLGGIVNNSGKINGAWRGYDFEATGLLKGIMGWQTPASVSNPCSAAYGKRYELTMVPATLAIKLIDNQAKNDDGSIGSTSIYRGVGISNFQIDLAAKGYMKASMDWIARRVEVQDVPYNTNSEPTDKIAPFYNAVLKWTPTGSGTATAFICNSFNLSVSRTIDTDSYSLGSQFLYNLNYNGLSDLSGTITLDSSDWAKIRAMMVGSNESSVKTLDQGKIEYFGVCSDGTVLANQIPSGKLEILCHTPDGTKVVSQFTIETCKLTDMTREATGQQKQNKTLKWKAEINNNSHFYVDVYSSA